VTSGRQESQDELPGRHGTIITAQRDCVAEETCSLARQRESAVSEISEEATAAGVGGGKSSRPGGSGSSVGLGEHSNSLHSTLDPQSVEIGEGNAGSECAGISEADSRIAQRVSAPYDRALDTLFEVRKPPGQPRLGFSPAPSNAPAGAQADEEVAGVVGMSAALTPKGGEKHLDGHSFTIGAGTTVNGVAEPALAAAGMAASVQDSGSDGEIGTGDVMVALEPPKFTPLCETAPDADKARKEKVAPSPRASEALEARESESDTDEAWDAVAVDSTCAEVASGAILPDINLESGPISAGRQRVGRIRSGAAASRELSLPLQPAIGAEEVPLPQTRDPEPGAVLEDSSASAGVDSQPASDATGIPPPRPARRSAVLDWLGSPAASEAVATLPVPDKAEVPDTVAPQVPLRRGASKKKKEGGASKIAQLM
jgi:hypothetical protein